MRKLIGTGTFTKAYQVSEDTVEVVSICPAKECYALFCNDNMFAPRVERLEVLDDGFQVYKMPLYTKIRAPKKQLNAKAYEIYKTLRDISNTYGMTYYKFCDAVNASNLDAETKEQVIDLVGSVCNSIDCDDLGFEISPRNISATAEGDLVMLDCFFSRKLLRTTWAR